MLIESFLTPASLSSRRESRQILTHFSSSQLELVRDLARDVLEADGRARDALEPDSVEREPGQLANLDLPLDEGVGVGVAVHTQQEEALALLVVAVVGIKDL